MVNFLYASPVRSEKKIRGAPLANWVYFVGVGFKHLYGCDFIPDAIALASQVCKSSFTVEGTEIRLTCFDILSIDNDDDAAGIITQTSNSDECNNKEGSVGEIILSSDLPFGQFDLIHDKGTFDLFYMRGDTHLYIESITRRFLHEGSIICVTSCNATEDELIDCFVNYEASSIRFHCISTLPHRSIQFQGLVGQVVSTAAFIVRMGFQK